jgi:hypothetical protein
MYALFFSLLLACSDPFAEAEKANKIETWEAYLATGPDGSEKMLAEQKLSMLLIDKAKAEQSVAAYDVVIKRFPKHKDIKTLKEERTKLAYIEADAAATMEGWKKFLDENADAPKLMKDKARGAIGVAEYGKIVVGEVKMEQVNLAEDPKGPKDGWGFKVDFKNDGDKVIDYLNVELRFLDAKGQQIGAEKWPLVGQQGPGGVPVSEETAKPLKPGESRVWDYSTGNAPTTWAQQVKVVPVAVRFAGTPANEGAQPK